MAEICRRNNSTLPNHPLNYNRIWVMPSTVQFGAAGGWVGSRCQGCLSSTHGGLGLCTGSEAFSVLTWLSATSLSTLETVSISYIWSLTLRTVVSHSWGRKTILGNKSGPAIEISLFRYGDDGMGSELPLDRIHLAHSPWWSQRTLSVFPPQVRNSPQQDVPIPCCSKTGS